MIFLLPIFRYLLNYAISELYSGTWFNMSQSNLNKELQDHSTTIFFSNQIVHNQACNLNDRVGKVNESCCLIQYRIKLTTDTESSIFKF